jgi:hypothetical protein
VEFMGSFGEDFDIERKTGIVAEFILKTIWLYMMLYDYLYIYDYYIYIWLYIYDYEWRYMKIIIYIYIKRLPPWGRRPPIKGGARQGAAEIHIYT